MSTCGQRRSAVHNAACVQHCAYPVGDKKAAPVPGGTRAAPVVVFVQRQRIDMTRPATIRPNPMAKFHALSPDMNGMLSPAT